MRSWGKFLPDAPYYNSAGTLTLIRELIRGELVECFSEIPGDRLSAGTGKRSLCRYLTHTVWPQQKLPPKYCHDPPVIKNLRM